MNRILAKRYAFCDFSSIVGFPNQVPSRDEWENSLPRFHGEEWEVPAEHLLDFHDYMHRLQVVHEDVQIRLFCFSLEGIARDWYRSLPNASVSSLADFHEAFHVFCEGIFPFDLLYPQCCNEFYLLNEDPNTHDKSVAAENISHHDQEIGSLQGDDHSIDAFNSIPHASTTLDYYADQIVPFESFKDDKQNDRSEIESFGSIAEVGLPICNMESNKGSSQLPDLQTKGSCPNHEELNGPDQQPIVYVPPTKIQQSTFINEFGEGNGEQLQHSQLEQQLQEVFHHVFHDPIADLLDSFSTMNVKIFMSEEGHFIHLLKPFFCMIWYLLLLGSRFSKMPVNHNLTWLHWKSSVT
jgi:hypothetical protein